MKRLAVVIGGALAMAIVASGGCADRERRDRASAEAAEQRYRILNGSTSDTDDRRAATEPDLNADTHFAAGQLAESTGKYPAAILQYEKALALKKDHLPALYRMGVVLTRAGTYDRAVETWKRYVKASGETAAAYSNLGFCHEMAGNAVEAERAYLKGIDRDGRSQPCRVNYGLMLARQRRTDEAKEQLSTVLRPDEVAYNLAAVYEQTGDLPQAKAELERAVQANPRNLAAQAKLAALK